MGMTNEQFKAYIQGIKDDISEALEMQKSPVKEVREYGEKKMQNLLKRLQEAIER